MFLAIDEERDRFINFKRQLLNDNMINHMYVRSQCQVQHKQCMKRDCK